MIVSSLIAGMFAATGLFALAAIVSAWRRYGVQFRALRGQLAALDDREEFVVRVAMTEVREFLPVARRSAAIRGRAASRQQQRPATRAAA